MQLWSNSFQEGAIIPGKYAFAVMDEKNHIALSTNYNPHLAWSGVPSGSQSLVLICHDPDVPSRADDVNQEHRIVPADLPRGEFAHWLLVDIPVGVDAIAEGQFSNGITARGKSADVAGQGAFASVRHGFNDYTTWFAGDAQMSGQYFGYDGPCPPWNDALVHRYLFTLYALDIKQLAVSGHFGMTEVRAAMKGHVLEQVALTGLYTLNPAVHI